MLEGSTDEHMVSKAVKTTLCAALAIAISASSLSLGAYMADQEDDHIYPPTFSDEKQTTAWVPTKYNPDAWRNIVRMTVDQKKDLTGRIKNKRNTTITWSSDDPTVAGVSEKGIVTAHSKGSCIITINYTDLSGASDRVKLTVKVVPEQSSSADMSVTLSAGQKKNLSQYIDARAGTSVDWTGNDPNVCALLGSTVTAKKVGDCIITARYTDAAGAKQTTTIAVTVAAAATAAEKTGVIRLEVGGTQSLARYVSDKQEGSAIVWTSDDTDVATVFNGTVRARKSGTTLAIAKYTDVNGKSQTKKITVIVARP